MRSRWFILAFALILPGILASFACGLDDSAIEALQGPSSGADATTIDGASGDDAATSDAKADDAHADAGADAKIVSTKLVYANTQTDLYSFDVSSLTLSHVATLSPQCGNNTNDLAIDSTGQLYIFESNDAIYALAIDGTCTARDVLSAMASDNLKITGRNAGTPAIVMIDTSHEDYFSIDPASTPQANVVKITNNYFPDSPKFDIVCASDGTCWTALDHSHCSAGSAGSCLYSFQADGSGSPKLLGAINVHPSGLAYANGALYGFDDDGTISSISLGASPVASVYSTSMLTFESGATLPGQWYGAGSSSAYTYP
jgi:hypothetical protein